MKRFARSRPLQWCLLFARHRLGLPLVCALVLGCTGELLNKSGEPESKEIATNIPEETDACTSPEQSFVQEMYVPVFSRCVGCHNEFGLVTTTASKHMLRFPGAPDFAEHNAAVLTELAERDAEVGGETIPYLLAKPTQGVPHAGGEVLAPDSRQAKLLESYIEKLRNPPSCEIQPSDTARELLDGATLASPRETYARAHLFLTGTHADPEAVWGMENTGAALEEELDKLLASEAFIERLGLFYADWFLTEADVNEVPGTYFYNDKSVFAGCNNHTCCNPEEGDRCCSTVLGREYCGGGDEEALKDLWRGAVEDITHTPIALLKHIAREDRPLTEFLTAKYHVLNPLAAAAWGLDDLDKYFDDDPANDRHEWKEVAVDDLGEAQAPGFGGGGGTPDQAGFLSNPQMLKRFLNTASNKHRTRGAHVVLRRLLAIPVLQFADFSTATLPPGADLEAATQDYQACQTCHVAIDPIARHFKNYWRGGGYSPDKSTRGTPEHLPEASFLGEQPPDSDQPLAWLGERLSSHRRYPIAMVLPMIEAATGVSMLSVPQDPGDPAFITKGLAFNLQQLALGDIVGTLPAVSETRFRQIVRATILSPLFRTKAVATSDPNALRAAALAGLGGGMLKTPELLEQSLIDLMGFPFDEPGPGGLLNSNGFRYVLGGTNWDEQPRLRGMNSVAVHAVERVAYFYGCRTPPREFSFPVEDRKLLKMVEPTTTDESTIREQMRWLYMRILGEDAAVDSGEVDALYELWSEARRIGKQEVATSRRGKILGCGINEKLVESGFGGKVLKDDPDYLIRAWSAVLAYLLSDTRFILE